MDQFNIEQQSRPDRSWYQVVRPSFRVFSGHTDEITDGTHTDRPTGWNDGRGFIYLRRYSMAICMIEALMITVLIFLLIRPPAETSIPLPPPPIVDPVPIQPSIPLNLTCRTFQSNATIGLKLTFLDDLVPGCNQRRHDQAFSVQCRSSQIDRCHPPYEPVTGPQPANHLLVIETSKSGSRMKQSWREVQALDCRNGQGAVSGAKLCRLGTRIESFDLSKGRQKIIGWGGALSDSTINSILSLSVNGTRLLMDDYFGHNGLLFNMVRVTIGGSDFSGRFYTNHDKETLFNSVGAKRPSEAKIVLMEEDYLYKIPLLGMVLSEYNFKGREIKLFASMWSPPVWMKTNRHFNKGQLRGSISDQPAVTSEQKSNEKYFELLAELKLNWLSEYMAHKIDFWGLTVMNEPIFAVQPFLNFNTMIFPRDDYANYIAKYLGPMLKKPPFEHIKLMIHDDNRRYLMNYTKPILDQERVRQFIDGVSVHGYVDQEYDMMDYMYDTYKGYKARPDGELNGKADDWFVLPTELCSGHLPFMEKALIGNWQRGVHYAMDIIHSLQHSAAGWIDWNMALDLEGGPGWLGGRLDAPIIVDKATDSYHKSPMFYVLGQFSRFIPPDSQRLDIRVLNQSYDNAFEVVAFVVPRSSESAYTRTRVVVVVLNDNPYEVRLLIPKAFGANNHNFYQLAVSPDSVTTVQYDLDST